MADKLSTDPLDILLAQINREHGQGTIMHLGKDDMPPIEVISSGSIALDEALGIGGLPRGRVIECYGPESSGKTTIALTHAAQVQKAGLRVAFIDAEHALDPDWATTLGVRVEADENGSGLLLSQPDTGEQALNTAIMLAKSGQVGLIIIDSVSALVPEAEIKGDVGDTHVGLQARMMSQALRMLTAKLSETKTSVIFINQLREKVGGMPGWGGPTETTTGGKALKFYASVRLDVRRIGQVKDGTDNIGNQVRVKVAKNKLKSPFKTAQFDLLFAEGISRAGELIDLGVERGIVKKAGAWYSYNGQQLGQGKEQTRQAFMAEPALAAEVEEKVRAAGPAPARASRPVLESDGSDPFA